MREYEALKVEGIKVAQGINKFNVDFLNSLVTETQAALKAAETAVEEAQQSLEHCIASTQSIQAEYSQIVSWAEMYDNCSFEAKKMIVAQFVKGVYVRKDYEIEIEFNVSFEDFKVFTLEQETQKKAEVRSITASDFCLMVDLKGFEPTTLRMRTVRSPN